MEGKNTDIHFDTAILTEQTETYSSLTDLNQIPLFTNEFAKRTLQMKTAEEKHSENLMEKNFSGNMNPGEEDIVLRQQIFTGTAAKIRKEESENVAENSQNGLVIGTLFFCFVTGLLVYILRRNRTIKDIKMSSEMTEGGM